MSRPGLSGVGVIRTPRPAPAPAAAATSFTADTPRFPAFLLAIIDEMDASEDYGPLVGGAAAYRKTGSHGPFVHLDTRGHRARW